MAPPIELLNSILWYYAVRQCYRPPKSPPRHLTLPFYYLGHAISKTVFLSSLALLLPVMVPPIMKNMKKIVKYVFIAQKKGADALNARQKTQIFTRV